MALLIPITASYTPPRLDVNLPREHERPIRVLCPFTLPALIFFTDHPLFWWNPPSF